MNIYIFQFWAKVHL